MRARESSELVDPKAVARLIRAQVHARLPMSGNMSGQHKSPHKARASSSPSTASMSRETTCGYWIGGSMRGRTAFISRNSKRTRICGRGSWSIAAPRWATRAMGASKLDYARRMAATLAYMLVRQGDAVGLTCLRRRRFWISPPGGIAAHLGNIFDGLGEAKAEGRDSAGARRCTRWRNGFRNGDWS